MHARACMHTLVGPEHDAWGAAGGAEVGGAPHKAFSLVGAKSLCFGKLQRESVQTFKGGKVPNLISSFFLFV